jgi:hypothetical protein
MSVTAEIQGIRDELQRRQVLGGMLAVTISGFLGDT